MSLGSLIVSTCAALILFFFLLVGTEVVIRTIAAIHGEIKYRKLIKSQKDTEDAH